MFCIKCGNQLKENDKFCPKCGQAVKGEIQEAAASEKTEILKKKSKAPLLIAVIAALVLMAGLAAFLCLRFLSGDKGTSVSGGNSGGNSTEESSVSGNTVSGSLPMTGAGYTTPLYVIDAPGSISPHAENYTPGTRTEGMTWDSTFFYWLEDISAEDTTDGNIRNCVIYKTELTDAETGNRIQYEIYKDAYTGEIYKIVSIERLETGLRLIDYYYQGGKPNFVFLREDSVYTPTYATIGKVGNRYYFNNDVMVRWRNIITPGVITEYVLTPGEVGYVQAAYANLSAEEQNAYDITERQLLNMAYNTYNAVSASAGIGSIEGRLTDTTGAAVGGITVKVYRKSDDMLLYEGVTDAEGNFCIYTYLDDTEVYLVIEETDIYKAYVINNIHLYVSSFGYPCNDIVMHRLSGDEYPVHVDLYAALATTATEAGMTTGSLLQGATVNIREGAGTREGDVLLTLTPEESGRVSGNLPSGIYTAQIQAEGYAESYLEIEVREQETFAIGYLLPEVPEEETAVVLTWEGAETDLDMTLFTPYQGADGDMAHVGGRIPKDEHGNYLVSDNSGYCEVMYVNTAEAGSYKLFVNNYTDSVAGNYESSALQMLEIRIYIYDSTGLVAVYTFPVSQNGVVWEVLELNGTTLVPINRVYTQVEGKKWWTENKRELNLDDCENLTALLNTLLYVAADTYGAERISDFSKALRTESWDCINNILYWAVYDGLLNRIGYQQGSYPSPFDVYGDSYITGYGLRAEEIERFAYFVTGQDWHLSSLEEISCGLLCGEYVVIGLHEGQPWGIRLENLQSTYIGNDQWKITGVLWSGGDYAPDSISGEFTVIVTYNSGSPFDGYSIVDISVEPVDAGWRQAYADYIKELYSNNDYFSVAAANLIYVDEDMIPELYVQGSDMATGDFLLTYYNGQVVKSNFWSDGGRYAPGSGFVCDSGGRGGWYYESIYQLINGEFVLKGTMSGSTPEEFFWEVESEWEYEYEWEGKSVTEVEYEALYEKTCGTYDYEECYENAGNSLVDMEWLLGW